MARYDRTHVVQQTETVVRSWLVSRLGKFRELKHDSMAINPFMAPIVMAIHSQFRFSELGELLVTAHLMGSHATGFGILVDRELIPAIFGTTKLDPPYRKTHPPYHISYFGDVDHLVKVKGRPPILLSVKAGRWTIQKGQAEAMNRSFANLIRLRGEGQTKFSKIVVGVCYGTHAELTDKFDRIRGVINDYYDVTDIRDSVQVLAGREFWAWLNGGEEATQEWIMEGVLRAKNAAILNWWTRNGCSNSTKRILRSYESTISRRMTRSTGSDY